MKRRHTFAGDGSKRRDRTYITWQHMRSRCLNPADKDYARYGGRGIKICERWNDYVNFLADMGPRPEGMQIDRMENDGNYEPDNCQWATKKSNAINRSSTIWIVVGGERRNATQWEGILGLPDGLISSRIRRGWSPERAVTTPLDKRYSTGSSKKDAAADAQNQSGDSHDE